MPAGERSAVWGVRSFAMPVSFFKNKRQAVFFKQPDEMPGLQRFGKPRRACASRALRETGVSTRVGSGTERFHLRAKGCARRLCGKANSAVLIFVLRPRSPLPPAARRGARFLKRAERMPPQADAGVVRRRLPKKGTNRLPSCGSRRNLRAARLLDFSDRSGRVPLRVGAG